MFKEKPKEGKAKTKSFTQPPQKLKNPSYKSISALLSPDANKNEFTGSKNSIFKNKAINQCEEERQNSLSKIASNPKMLTMNSYIKLKDISSKNIESLVENLGKRESSASKLRAVKSTQSLLFNRETQGAEKRRVKFIRNSPVYNQENLTKRKKSVEKRQQMITEKYMAQKDKEIARLKGQLELTVKNLELKNKKIKELQKILDLVKKQSKERISQLEEELFSTRQELIIKQNNIADLEEELVKQKNENKYISGKVQELMNEPILEKQTSISLTGQTEVSHEEIKELQNEIHKKNLQIYMLKKNIDKIKIKEYYLEVKHEEEIKWINTKNQKKYKELLDKYKMIENKNRMSQLKGPMRKDKMFQHAFEEMSSIDLSFSPES